MGLLSLMPQSPLTGGIVSPMPGGPGEEDDDGVREDEGEGGNPCANHAGPDEECYPTPEGGCECFEVVDVVDDGGTDSKHPSLPIDWFLTNEVPDLDAAFLDDFLRGLREVGDWVAGWVWPEDEEELCPTMDELKAQHSAVARAVELDCGLGTVVTAFTSRTPWKDGKGVNPLKKMYSHLKDVRAQDQCKRGCGKRYAEALKEHGLGDYEDCRVREC